MYKSRVRRSRLIMPINQSRFLEKAWLRNADAIVLDLEDSVPYNEKVASRGLIQQSIPMVKRGGSDLFIRINSEKELLMDDLKASIFQGVDGIVLPKVECGAELQEITNAINRYELDAGIQKGHVKISLLIETAKGYLNMRNILESSDRIDALSLGAEDFIMDLGMSDDNDAHVAISNVRLDIVIYARAYNILPLGLVSPITDYQNILAIEDSAIKSKKIGFVGASCIHPAQVEVFNRIFQPSKETLEESKELIRVFELSLANGRASTVFQGKMIDQVHYIRAKKVVKEATSILAFEEQKAFNRVYSDLVGNL